MKGKRQRHFFFFTGSVPSSTQRPQRPLLVTFLARGSSSWRVESRNFSWASLVVCCRCICGHIGALGSFSRRLVPHVCDISHITFLDSWSAEDAFDWGFGHFLPFVRGSLVVDITTTTTTTTTTAISLASRASCVPSLVRALASEGTFLQSVPSLGAPNTDLREEGRTKRRNIEAS